MSARAANRGRKYPIQIQSRVSAKEMEKIRDEAERAGMSICKYIRERATGGHVSGKIDVKTLQELNAIGRMLKKMWSEGHPTGPALDAVQAAAETLQQQI